MSQELLLDDRLIDDYNSVENIIYIRRKGKYDLQTMIDFIEKIDNKYRCLSRVYIFNDYSGSESIYRSTDYLYQIIEVIKERAQKYEYIKMALLVSEPIDFAFSAIYNSMVVEISNLYSKTFSNADNAKYWLLMR